MNANKAQSPTVLSPKAIVKTMNESSEHAAGLSVLVNISYQSLSGHFKGRDILIRRVIHNKNDYYLDGFALDIQAPRLIKASQISTIRDVSTGRLYENPSDFLRDRFGLDGAVTTDADMPAQPQLTDFARLIQETGPEMTVLMYLVAIDGMRRPAERHLVLDYIKRRTPHLNYRDEDLNEYLISLAPDEETCTLALHYVMERGKAVVEMFLEVMVNIIASDGNVNLHEKAFLARTIDLLEQDGYTFTVPPQTPES